ncbi:MAG: hypothetical protein M3Z03_02960 [Actinomycetota bacterium]|nr:hypothetical protein [Actinomycetota bacterium]
MSWSTHLDHIDDVVRRVERALEAGDALAASAAIDELGHEPTGLPPIPADLAARARRAISQLTSLDTEVRLAMGRLGAELSLLDRARPASRPPHYVDTSA